MGVKILVSAGEASGDRYAARLVEAIQQRLPTAEFFGCTGIEMRSAGVRTVVDSASLSVVGLVEVVGHLPRIYGEYRKLIAAAEREKPDLAILTDSPDFHLRLAARLRERGIPVVYLVAPQIWAWREGRIGTLRRNVTHLQCIFPFEERYFQDRGVRATYIGHPLARLVEPTLSRQEFFAQHRIEEGQKVITICPGSRRGEIERHLPVLAAAAGRIAGTTPAVQFLAVPAGASRFGSEFFSSQIGDAPLRVIEGQTWNALAYADVGIIASGTVTVEAALLGTPMLTFYKVSPWSWFLGRRLVKVPHLTMVNLVAGRRVVPEYMQDEATPERLADEALRLLNDPAARTTMKEDLAEVRRLLRSDHDPMQFSAELVLQELKR